MDNMLGNCTSECEFFSAGFCKRYNEPVKKNKKPYCTYDPEEEEFLRQNGLGGIGDWSVSEDSL